MFHEDDELPYFDAAGNEYVRELRKQDAYLRRGGRLSAPQMIKYENRVSMLVERLILVLDALKGDNDAIHDYLVHIEQAFQSRKLPEQVFRRFSDQVHQSGRDEAMGVSERDRDRLRVIKGGPRADRWNLGEHSQDQLIDMYRNKSLTSNALFQEFYKREQSGKRLSKMDSTLWGSYRTWLQQKNKLRRRSKNDDRP